MVNKMHLISSSDHTGKLSDQSFESWSPVLFKYKQITAKLPERESILSSMPPNKKKSKKQPHSFFFICIMFSIMMLTCQPLLGPNFFPPPWLHLLCSRRFLLLSECGLCFNWKEVSELSTISTFDHFLCSYLCRNFISCLFWSVTLGIYRLRRGMRCVIH